MSEYQFYAKDAERSIEKHVRLSLERDMKMQPFRTNDNKTRHTIETPFCKVIYTKDLMEDPGYMPMSIMDRVRDFFHGTPKIVKLKSPFYNIVKASVGEGPPNKRWVSLTDEDCDRMARLSFAAGFISAQKMLDISGKLLKEVQKASTYQVKVVDPFWEDKQDKPSKEK